MSRTSVIALVFCHSVLQNHSEDDYWYTLKNLATWPWERSVLDYDTVNSSTDRVASTQILDQSCVIVYIKTNNSWYFLIIYIF